MNKPKSANSIVAQDWVSVAMIVAGVTGCAGIALIVIAVRNEIPWLTIPGAALFLTSTAVWVSVFIAMTVQLIAMVCRQLATRRSRKPKDNGGQEQ